MKLQKLKTAWFTMEEDPDKSKFEIKHLRSGEVAKIVDATHKQRFEFRKDKDNDKMVPVPIFEISQMDETERTILECVVGWEKVFDEEGKSMKCTAENKIRFCKELSEQDFAIFSTFIQDNRKVLSDMANKAAKATEKN